MPQVTIYDIASRLGISASTVSRALNGKGRVSEGLRKKIVETQEEMGYVPNPVARSLKGRDSDLIMLIMPNIIQTQAQMIYFYLHDALNKMGYQVISTIIEGDDAQIRSALKLLSNHNPAFLLLMDSIYQTDAVRDIIKSNFKHTPTFIIDGKIDLPNVYSIRTDYNHGIKVCTQYLRDQSRKCPAFLMSLHTPMEFEKRDAFVEAMADIYPDVEPIIVDFKTKFNFSPNATRILMENYPLVDSIIFSRDIDAIVGYQTLYYSQTRKLEDYMLVSAGNSFYTDYHTPFFTILKTGIISKCDLLELYIEKLRNGEEIQRDTIVTPQLGPDSERLAEYRSATGQ